MFRYQGKNFITVDEMVRSERNQGGMIVSRSAEYRVLEALRKKGLLAKRRNGTHIGYTPVSNNQQLMKYDQIYQEVRQNMADLSRQWTS